MKTFHSVSNPVYTTLISGLKIPANQGFRPKVPPSVLQLLETHDRSITLPALTTTHVQTMFRESESQTDPFVPQIKRPFQSGLEVLTLSWLSWNNHLPAGIREVIIIERARQKRAWQKALPSPFNTASAEIQNIILEAIELNEWNFRETELAAISSIRFDLARKCMQDNLAANRIKYENRIFNYLTVKSEEKKAALKKVRLQLKRNLRRLTYAHNNVNRRYCKWDVVREFEDRTSEYYAPKLRFGVHPKRAHEIIPKPFRYWNVFSSGDILTHNMNKMTQHIQKFGFDYETESKPRQHFQQLCIRETRWTDLELEKLHTTVKLYRVNAKKISAGIDKCSIRQQREHICLENISPVVTGVSDEEENDLQAAISLQKIIKGRAIQAVMFEGRVRCQELIDEVKSTHALQKCMEDVRKESRQAVCALQRNAELKALEEKRKSEILASLEGKTVADILDFLSKELIRIRNERETHAIALMAERERHEKEAAEAGRRQKEIERTRELEEMWRQICKVYQNSVDAIMEESLMMGRKNFGEGEARLEATEYAKRIDAAAMDAHLRKNQLEEEEIVADLVYNFALPEAEKIMVRSRLKERQKLLLSSCHDEIYSQIESVARGKRSPSGRLLPLPVTIKRKGEQKNFLRYLKLPRQSSSNNPSASRSASLASVKSHQNYSPSQHYEFSESDHWSTGFSRQEVVMDKPH